VSSREFFGFSAAVMAVDTMDEVLASAESNKRD
jgi:hypothetical protein